MIDAVVGWGIFLIIVGAGSLLLPSLGFQFPLMRLVNGFQPFVGIVAALIGAALLFVGWARGSRTGEVSRRPAATPSSNATEGDDPSPP